MANTFAHRQKWIKNDCPTCSAILDRFPIFKNIPSLIAEEFKMIFKSLNLTDFGVEWPYYNSKIISYAKKINETATEAIVSKYAQSNCENEKNKICLELLCILTGSLACNLGKNSKRVSKYDIFQFIFQSFRLGQGNEEMLTHCNKFTKQPIIICITNDTQNQYFIRLDNNFIFCSNNFVNTIEIFCNVSEEHR